MWFAVEVSVLFCGISLLVKKGDGLNTTRSPWAPDTTQSTGENPTQERKKSISQEIIAWILEGSTWKIILLAAGGLFLLTCLILAVYRLRKWRKSKRRQPEEEKTMDITVPGQDCTFMGSRSGGVVPTAEMQDCTNQRDKPQLKSKMLGTFTNEGKTRYSFGMTSQRRSQREDCVHQEVAVNVTETSRIETSNVSSANTSKNSGFFAKWRKQEQNRQEEAIYQNQESLESSRKEYSSSKTQMSNTEPDYENSQNIMTQQRLHNRSDYVNAQAFHYQQQQHLGQSDDGLDYVNVPHNAYDLRQKYNVGSMTLQTQERHREDSQDHRNNAVRRSKSNVENFKMQTQIHQFGKSESLDWGRGMDHQTNTQSLMNALGTNKQSNEWQRSGQIGRQQNYPPSSQMVDSFEEYDDIKAYRL